MCLSTKRGGFPNPVQGLQALVAICFVYVCAQAMHASCDVQIMNKFVGVRTHFVQYWVLKIGSHKIDQWFSTGVPRNPWVPSKALGVTPICELEVYVLFRKLQLGLPPNCSSTKEVCCESKRLRNSAIDEQRLKNKFLINLKLIFLDKRKSSRSQLHSCHRHRKQDGQGSSGNDVTNTFFKMF